MEEMKNGSRDSHAEDNDQLSENEQVEKDQDDGSERPGKSKEQLPAERVDVVSASASGVGAASKAPEVEILSMSMESPGRPDLDIPIITAADPNTSKRSLYTLMEGSRCRMKVTFVVRNNVVSGLKHTYTVWKAGIRVDNTIKTLGSYSPREEPYTHKLDEHTIPRGVLIRGHYFVRIKFIDGDGRCYLDFSYYFDIGKSWEGRSARQLPIE